MNPVLRQTGNGASNNSDCKYVLALLMPISGFDLAAAVRRDAMDGPEWSGWRDG
ncbi:hypothetical protein [Sandarakinorhabdus limnophila]|jgi:hypothetical protein|uniref:hypothetical protein n=1 Tax=Sandarakinorhabdus limnophila TaxID=210512 RepID=UPI0026F29210|nr:hypothetical protein [Sandarakinorhabdus limnophila]